MRMSTGKTYGCRTICPGTFKGGEIEPGTFHGGEIEPGTFHGSFEAQGRTGQSSASDEDRPVEANEKPPVDTGPVEQDASEKSE